MIMSWELSAFGMTCVFSLSWKELNKETSGSGGIIIVTGDQRMIMTGTRG